MVKAAMNATVTQVFRRMAPVSPAVPLVTHNSSMKNVLTQPRTAMNHRAVATDRVATRMMETISESASSIMMIETGAVDETRISGGTEEMSIATAADREVRAVIETEEGMIAAVVAVPKDGLKGVIRALIQLPLASQAHRIDEEAVAARSIAEEDPITVHTMAAGALAKRPLQRQQMLPQQDRSKQ